MTAVRLRPRFTPALEAVPAVACRRSPADLAVAAAVVLWIPVVLVADRGASLGEQHLLGGSSAALLLGLLVR